MHPAVSEIACMPILDSIPYLTGRYVCVGWPPRLSHGRAEYRISNGRARYISWTCLVHVASWCKAYNPHEFSVTSKWFIWAKHWNSNQRSTQEKFHLAGQKQKIDKTYIEKYNRENTRQSPVIANTCTENKFNKQSHIHLNLICEWNTEPTKRRKSECSVIETKRIENLELKKWITTQVRQFLRPTSAS